jgi:hypothetical protein
VARFSGVVAIAGRAIAALSEGVQRDADGFARSDKIVNADELRFRCREHDPLPADPPAELEFLIAGALALVKLRS